ncbi:MAG: TonB-dependent receptor [Hydrogenophilales bacterium 28-61-23]|nr:MAG: TonB-dependent receptor [Hydrogenophilales bacterium 28-61-23]
MRQASKTVIRKLLVNSLAAYLAAISLAAMAQETLLDTIVVTASKPDVSSPFAARLDKQALPAKRASTSDTARLLEDIPGLSLYGAGGISSLPAIHGLADDRLRTQVDGMDLMTACPNHMNSALSFIDPTSVASVEVFAGITPVSLGGDSIGGTIQVKSAPPKFAKADAGLLTEARAGIFYRSNGNARGNNFGVTLAGRQLNLTYAESISESDNYRAAADFKLPGLWQSMGEHVLPGNEVGSSEYGGSRDRSLGLGLRLAEHLLKLTVSEQRLDYEGFPNQRMDMIASVPDPSNPGGYIVDKNQPSNINKLVNLGYTGQYQWGELEARVFRQDLRHHMDMIQDRFFGMLMPMDTEATTVGGLIKGGIDLSATDTLRLGSDFQRYRLDDWWPPIGTAPGSMCCDDFWNIRDGKRDRVGIFAEWEARWAPEWLTLVGIRSDTVKSDAGQVQGYSTVAGNYAADSAAFNALDRQRIDHNLDWTLLARYTPNAMQTYEAGFSRKSRSPNLYERYPWSAFSMAALMNNFVGDGNAYIGNLDLMPEVAHAFSATVDWHGAERKTWGIKATGYVTQVDDFIDAKRCSLSGCGGATNLTKTNGYVSLQYVNQSARLYGLDISGHRLLVRSGNSGSFTGTGGLNYVRGENRSTGDNLYHMMPLNAKLALVHRLDGWTTSAEIQWVADKTKVSQVRNEVPTGEYSLFNLRSSYEWKHARIDIGVENVFDTFYLLPLGGAYLGQGNSMTSNGVPWGMSVPGKGRSVNVALNLNF